MTIVDTGVRGMIAVGLVPQLYKLDHQPGWLPHSVAFHADDGKYVSCIVLFLNMFFSVLRYNIMFIYVT